LGESPSVGNSLEQLAQAVAASSAPDPDWSSGQVLTYLRPSRVKSRGRGRGTPGLGIAAVCIGSIGTALELLGGTLAALKFSDDQIKMVIVGGLPVAVCGVIVGTIARRYEDSRQLGTVGRWVSYAAPVALALPLIFRWWFSP
jgi:hypothetical protein